MNNIYKPYYCVSVSGGKDSLYMFLELLNRGFHIDEVVTACLEIENPIETKVKDRIEELCKKSGIIFTRVYPRLDYQSLYDRYDLPNPDRPFLWCQKFYKQQALRELEIRINKLGYTCVTVCGFCADETKRFYRKGLKNGTVWYPLADWGIDENTILQWARTCSIFDGWYDSFNRLGCTMCPFCKEAELQWLIAKGYKIYSLNNGINFNHKGKGEKL